MQVLTVSRCALMCRKQCRERHLVHFCYHVILLKETQWTPGESLLFDWEGQGLAGTTFYHGNWGTLFIAL